MSSVPKIVQHVALLSPTVSPNQVNRKSFPDLFVLRNVASLATKPTTHSLDSNPFSSVQDISWTELFSSSIRYVI